jgi:hypothetical protein
VPFILRKAMIAWFVNWIFKLNFFHFPIYKTPASENSFLDKSSCFWPSSRFGLGNGFAQSFFKINPWASQLVRINLFLYQSVVHWSKYTS